MKQIVVVKGCDYLNNYVMSVHIKASTRVCLRSYAKILFVPLNTYDIRNSDSTSDSSDPVQIMRNCTSLSEALFEHIH